MVHVEVGMRRTLGTRFGMSWLALGLVGCEGGFPDINLFTIEDDKKLGAELAAEIAANPQEYGTILDRGEYADAYGHLDRIRDELLATGEVDYADDFLWETHIIHDDETLNAFAAPGGYIYVYTGILRYLEVEDHFVGVMGHEIAHAANRHSTEQMSKAYGIQTLLEITLGKGGGGVIGDVASGLVGLEFSREDEAEADEYSVIYLCETDWAADGTAGFFEKIESEGGYDIPEFLSTHPSSASRVEDIRAEAADRGCSTDLNPDPQWVQFMNALPPERRN
jgi:predicted Zn-dependent protease